MRQNPSYNASCMYFSASLSLMTERVGVGIPQAVDAAGRTFGRAAIEREPRPFTEPLHCGGCSTRVQPVSGYTTRDGTRVNPLYRLTHRLHAPHDNDCRYDFDAQAGRLLEEHRHAISKTGDSYELRLPETTPQTDSTDPESHVHPEGRDRLTVHTRRGHTLEPVLSAASAIARLIATYENDPEACARFSARWKGRRISWDDFYFDTAHDARHLAHVVADGDHPVAVSGLVKRAGRTTNDSADLVELDTERGVSHPPTGRWIHIRILRKDPDRLSFDVGQRVIGYGQWTTYTPERSKNRYLHLWIDHRSLLAVESSG